MFVLGKLAEKFPNLIREMHDRGHEIASHGYGHVEIFKQSRQQFEADVRRSKDVLEQIVGARLKGYRAPDFSIVQDTLWCFDTLAELGFEYDSSIFPVRHSRYGIPDWPATPVAVELSNGQRIIEIPVATFSLLRKRWPVGGGGYHRLLPGFIFRHIARSVMSSGPFVFYCHPYELDPSELREVALRIPRHVRLHQGLGRRRVMRRLKAFLKTFGGRRAEDLIGRSNWPHFDPVRLHVERAG